MRSARLRKNLHQVHSKQKKKYLNPKYFGSKEQKGLKHDSYVRAPEFTLGF